MEYQVRGKTRYFDPYTNRTKESIDETVLNNPIAIYEVYRQLPWIIKGPLSILKVSVSGERTKIILIIISSLAVMLLGLAVPLLTGFIVQALLLQSGKHWVIKPYCQYCS